MTSRSLLSSPRAASILLGVLLLVPQLGCGQAGNSKAKIGGAVVSDEVEAANRATEEAYAAEAKGKNKKKK